MAKAAYNLEDDVIRRLVKMVDIVYITIMYAIPALAVGIYLDKLYGQFDPKKHDRRPLLYTAADVATHIGIMGIVAYLARNVIPLIPFPLEGIRGYQHTKTKEVANATFFMVFMVAVQSNLPAKFKYLNARIRKQFKIQ